MTEWSSYIVEGTILGFTILLAGIFCTLSVILTAGLFKRFTGHENAITRWIARKGS